MPQPNFHQEAPSDWFEEVELPQIPDDLEFPSSAKTPNAKTRFRLANAVVLLWFPGRVDLLPEAALWLYEDPWFYPELSRTRSTLRSINIRKNKMAKDPPFYLEARWIDVNSLPKPGDPQWGDWITIDEDGTATFVQKDRFEHWYLPEIHFVLTTQIDIPRYIERFVEGVGAMAREKVWPPMDNLQFHRACVNAALRDEYLDDAEKAFVISDSHGTPLEYLERRNRIDLLRIMGDTKLEDLIPPVEPELKQTDTRHGITVTRRGVINLGPFTRDLQEMPDEIGDEHAYGDPLGDVMVAMDAEELDHPRALRDPELGNAEVNGCK